MRAFTELTLRAIPAALSVRIAFACGSERVFVLCERVCVSDAKGRHQRSLFGEFQSVSALRNNWIK